MNKNYEKFASVHGAIMDDSLYNKQTDFSLRHFPKDKKKLLGLACGTGIQSVRFVKAGFDVTRFDLSENMLEVARKRVKAANEAIELKQGSILDLSQAGKYDLVTCYSDSICYMADEAEVGNVFKQAHDCLNEDGVFIFDVYSTYQTDTVLPGYSYHEDAEEFAMVWDIYADEALHSVVYELTFFLQDGDGRFTCYDEVHEERTYEALTYDILLEQTGFKSFKFYTDFEDKKLRKRSNRWPFVCQKQGGIRLKIRSILY